MTDSAVTEFIYELDRIVKEPVSAADLSLAKNSMTGNFGRSLESPQTIANFALNTYRYNLPKDYYNNYLKIWKQSVLTMFRKWLKIYQA